MLNEMLNLSGCPVCGRDVFSHPHSPWWCPFCGDSDTRLLRQQVNGLNKRLTIIENYAIWHPVITDMEDI